MHACKFYPGSQFIRKNVISKHKHTRLSTVFVRAPTPIILRVYQVDD